MPGPGVSAQGHECKRFRPILASYALFCGETRQPLTILCGIGGVIIGWYIYVLFGGNGSPGIDWTRWLLAIVVAAVLVIAADAIMVRSKSRRTQV
jgi:hypothetical protein